MSAYARLSAPVRAYENQLAAGAKSPANGGWGAVPIKFAPEAVADAGWKSEGNR
jgi:hypothetical protein